jgi:hypothetical protein
MSLTEDWISLPESSYQVGMQENQAAGIPTLANLIHAQ